MGTIDNKVVFKSGLEMTFQQYRGQVKDYTICNANIYRTKDYSQIFLQICRTIAFENLLDKHPYIKMLKKRKFMDKDIYINNTAIAQHYELQTPYLDLTSNFDIASFFATSVYNSDSKSYQPYLGTKNLGVIYVYNEITNMFMNDQTDRKFEYLGWQGLPRPEEQKGSIFHLKNNEDFNLVSGVKKYNFKHCPSLSKRIWNNFGKGKTLFPDDTAADLANESKKLITFTNEEIVLAKKRFLEWIDSKVTEEEFIEMTKKLEIDVVEESSLSWDLLMNIKESYWLEKVNNVFGRTQIRMCY